MNHVASLIAFNLSIILTFTALIMLLLIHNNQEARRKCMMNHPAGSQRATELDRIQELADTLNGENS